VRCEVQHDEHVRTLRETLEKVLRQIRARGLWPALKVHVLVALRRTTYRRIVAMLELRFRHRDRLTMVARGSLPSAPRTSSAWLL